ncbi:MAG: hypothetical protein CMF37_14905 [Leeuwenhoekiella sp.]|nr:hypothetical protein [Leeuwenhoekiella sp.]MBQ50096.1 hypothetical protein [Leeuwenhoekiella sp.]MBQ50293.1 hypothetical protein [Leeuwenhoekiella sp.]MBQ50490.1 hypothetical protein [Leeuwenhoekiella sp.]
MFKLIANIIKETILLISELPYLKYINSSVGQPVPEFGNEGTAITKEVERRSKVKLALAIVVTGDSRTKILDRFFAMPVYKGEVMPIVDFNKHDEHWYFINGIMTNQEVFDVNLHGLSKLLNRPVMGLYNPSKGMYRDLVESVIGRATDSLTPIARVMAQHLFYPVLSGKPIRIIGHSQGAIILSNVAKILQSYGFELNNVEFFTIAGAHDEFPQVPMVEHFGNEKDYVYRIGAKHYQARICGEQYVRDLGGHLLNRHYLTGINQGNYCSGRSRLYSHIQSKKEE